MALTQSQISELFVAVFGRASEGSGVTYFSNYVDQAAAANAMFNTSDPTVTVVTDYFGVTEFTSQASVEIVIKAIFKNALGRDLDTETPVATKSGASDNIKDTLAYFSGLATGNGSDGIAGNTDDVADASIGYMVQELIKAANLASHQTSGDAAAKAAQDQFKNMVAVSDHYASVVALPTADFIKDSSIATGVLSGVTKDPASVVTGKSAADVVANASNNTTTGVVFTLTSALDSGVQLEESNSVTLVGVSETVDLF